MFKGFRVVLRSLLTKRESEIMMRLSKVRIITDRLFELNPGGSEIFGVHKGDALVVNFKNRIANFLSRQVLNWNASTTASRATTASTARAHCSNCCSSHYANAEKEAPLKGLMRPAP